MLLVAGDPDLRLTFRAGEVVRLWLTNTANTRVFNVTLPGARMKLVGGDSGRVEHEEFVEQVVLAPSERVVVDVLVESPGELDLEHHTPDRTYRLAAITVTEGPRRRPPPRSSGSCAGPRSWRPSVPSWTAGWPRPRTRSWHWSPRWTTQLLCRRPPGRSLMPARCIPSHDVTSASPAAAPSAA